MLLRLVSINMLRLYGWWMLSAYCHAVLQALSDVIDLCFTTSEFSGNNKITPFSQVKPETKLLVKRKYEQCCQGTC